jgi:tetratricopeptide (TPR) repeat protein
MEPNHLEQSPDQPEMKQQDRRRPWIWLLWALLGVTLLVLIALASGYSGYLAAIDQRTSFELTSVAAMIEDQYNLAMQDIADNHLDLARQRLEYIIRLNPQYPGAADQLAEVMVMMSITATPTTIPSPTLTPTEDLRDRDELFQRSKELLAGGDWSRAIETLLVLRKKDPEFNAVEVDGMLYLALRNRGVYKISQEADLEGGIYDLALAEAFGPLDVDASGWREWATLYIRGASFWGVNWQQAVQYFSQVAPYAPTLRDSSGRTAFQRYYESLIGYGDWLAAQGAWCDAHLQYEEAQRQRNLSEVEPTITYLYQQCLNTPTPTPSPTGQEPPVTLTPESTPQP